MAEKAVNIECRSQGIRKEKLSHKELMTWLQEEENFWNELPDIDRHYMVANQNYGSPGIVNGYKGQFRNIRNLLERGDYSGIENFLKLAEELRVVLAHGTIGTEIRKLIIAGDAVTAQRLILTFSDNLNPRVEIKADVAPLKVALKFNPYQITTADIISASDALKEANQTATEMEAAHAEQIKALKQLEDNLNAYVQQTGDELKHLHEMYERHLILQGPSRHWGKVSKTAFKYASWSLCAFIAMLVLPTVVIWCNWSAVSAYIDHTLDVTKGSLSLASLVVFTVPVLAYGWLLKHISRIFTQNLMVNADAEHRRVMAITFLGLAKRKAVGISEQDRALILNALFRPSPTSPQDDGPPSGLLDLISKK